MSDGNNQQSQGCLVIFVLILTVILVLLIMMCYKKVELTSLLPTLPTGTSEQTDTPTKETKPKQTEPEQTKPTETKPKQTEPEQTKPTETKPEEIKPTETEPAETEPEHKPAGLSEDEFTEEPQKEDQEAVPTDSEPPEEQEYLVVIDAGHQEEGNHEKEPIGPGATETKAKVTSGTQGVVTGVEEYELNLQVAKKLKKILQSRGYQVKMVRSSHDVNMSNAERAEVANELQADAFIRIHANGDENSETRGIMTLCQTKNNPYNADLYSRSKALSLCVLEETVAATGGKKQFVWETDTMSGINWSRVPVTIVEMGYMTNPEEDKLMATEDYQQKLAEGMANGIDRYFKG